MAIRENVVASAVEFLRDPSVASSPVESKIAFLQTKNLTREEIDASLARIGSEPAPPTTAAAVPYSAAPPRAPQPPPPYYGQPQAYPPYAWQQPPLEPPRRDWRDWFIMATVVSGVSYGVYSLTKRYIYPLVAPPTPERLETDKKAIDEQFDRAFALVEQLAKDTEALKAAEQQRTERLDTALSDLEAVIVDLKSANRRREDDAQRVRDEVQDLKGSIPKALDAQKELSNERLKEINAELSSLKTLLSQRLNSAAPSAGAGYFRPTGTGVLPVAAAASSSSSPVPTASENGNATPSSAAAAAANDEGSSSESQQTQDAYRSPFGLGGGSSGARAAIPEWQRVAMGAKASPSSANGTESSQSAAAAGAASQ